jgi:hypothetical protein
MDADARPAAAHLPRIYFSDEAEANAKDTVLNSVPAERRDTLIAKRSESGGAVTYRLDIPCKGLRRRCSSTSEHARGTPEINKARCKRACFARPNFTGSWMSDSGTVFSSPGSELM